MPFVDELNHRFGIAGGVRFAEQAPDFVVAEITTAGGDAVIALQGAQVVTWTPRGAQPVIWVSSAAKFAPGKSIRGGVPICWPWFGPHADASKPGHGYARTVPWTVVSSQALADGSIQMTFELEESAATRAQWPHSTPVRALITVGSTLTVELVTRNASAEPVTLGEALHTYLQVSDIGDVEITGLGGVTYVDKVENSARKQQQGSVTISGEVDRVYLNTAGECAVVDRGYNRRIRISKQGSNSTVVWNPWVEKADKMGDLGPEGYRHMLCVESGNALDDVVTLAPGAEHRMLVVYRSEPL